MDEHTDESDYLDWLIEFRSKNQAATLALYKLVRDPESAAVFANAPALFDAAQELTAIAFSLWRAVFLNDLTGRYEKQAADLQSFLHSLVTHNSIQYMTDYNAREWSFWYYMKDARQRLKYFDENIMPGIVPHDFDDRASRTARGGWENAQDALDHGIANFKAHIFARR